MNNHRAFELEVLGWVADDYEAPHTISGDIARELGTVVSESDVRAALLALAERGLVQAYVYESASQAYRPITPTEARTAKEAWFMASASGVQELERHAS